MKHKQHVRVVYSDYDEALRGAIVQAWGAARFGDFFHFMQANVRALRDYHIKNTPDSARQSTVIAWLRTLWYSADRATFQSNLKEFVENLKEMKEEQYLQYFEVGIVILVFNDCSGNMVEKISV